LGASFPVGQEIDENICICINLVVILSQASPLIQ
jgi:hypothetical protein